MEFQAGTRADTQTAVLVLADIGGYTRFMKQQEASLAHAEAVINDLLGVVVETAEHPLTVNKLEGDAVLFYALATPQTLSMVAKSALEQVNGFFKAFAVRKQEMVRDAPCSCDPCRSIDTLSIKAVLHCGEVTLRKVRKFEELTGVSVITAHRLMKNSVPLQEYILVTDVFDQAAGGLPGQTGVPLFEHCEGIGPVKVKYYEPDRSLSTQAAPNFWRQLSLMRRTAWYLLRRRFGLLPKRKFHNLASS